MHFKQGSHGQIHRLSCVLSFNSMKISYAGSRNYQHYCMVAHHLIRFIYTHHAFIKYYCTVFTLCCFKLLASARCIFIRLCVFHNFFFFSLHFSYSSFVFIVTTSQFFELFCGRLYFYCSV